MTNTIIIYNTLNTNKLKTIIDSVFSVSWGDGSSDTIVSMPTVYDTDLPYASHTYVNDGSYDIEITVDSPWKVQKLKRKIINASVFPLYFKTALGHKKELFDWLSLQG